jgi:hypothetical protein
MPLWPKIEVANFFSGNVTALQSSDGPHLGTFLSRHSAVGAVFDGVNIWLASSGSDLLSTSVGWR